MVKREWEVDPKFIVDIFTCVLFLNDVIDVADTTTDEEGEDERRDVMMSAPDVDVNTRENSEKREPPADSIDDGSFSRGEELVDDISQEEDVDKGPDPESILSGSEISLLAGGVAASIFGACDGVDVRAQEEDKAANVNELEQDAIFPGI